MILVFCSAAFLNLSVAAIWKVGIMESAKDLWDKLDELYTETSLPSKMFLLAKLFRFKLDLNKDIDENLDVFTKLVQDIKLAGDKHIDDYTPFVLLNSFPDSYSDVKSAIKYGRDSVTLETIVYCLKLKELDLKNAGDRNKGSGEVMHVSGRSKSRQQKHAKNSENQSNDSGGKKKNYDKGRSKFRSKGRKCYNCSEVGHYIKQCPKPNKNKNDEHANVASVDNMGDVLMVTSMCSTSASSSSVNSVSDALGESEWLVESGCTFHISPYKNLFSSVKEVENGCVSLANKLKCKVVGVGGIFLKFDSGTVFTLKNVRYVPDLCYNLLSCAALEEDGLEGRWGKGIMKILKGSLVVFKAEKKNNLYICHAKCVSASSSVNTMHEDKTFLWHKRLGT